MKQYFFFCSFVLFCIICTYGQNAYSNSLIVFSNKNDTRTWEDAMTKCAADGGRLLVANSRRAINSIFHYSTTGNRTGKY